MILLKKFKYFKKFSTQPAISDNYKFMIIKSSPSTWNEQTIYNFLGGFNTIDIVKKINSSSQNESDFVVKFKNDESLPISCINNIQNQGGNNISIQLTKEIILETPEQILLICDKNGNDLNNNLYIQQILSRYETVSLKYKNEKESVATLWIKNNDEYDSIINELNEDNSLYFCSYEKYILKQYKLSSDTFNSLEAQKLKTIRNRLHIFSLDNSKMKIQELINEERTIQSIYKEKESIANYKKYIAFANNGIYIHDK